MGMALTARTTECMYVNETVWTWANRWNPMYYVLHFGKHILDIHTIQIPTM